MRGTTILRRVEPVERRAPHCPACWGELSYFDIVYRSGGSSGSGGSVVGCDRCLEAERREDGFPLCPFCGAALGADNALLLCRRAVVGCEHCIQPVAAADVAAQLAAQ